MKITGIQPDTAGFSHNGQSITLVDGIAEVDTQTGVELIQAGLALEWVAPEVPEMPAEQPDDTQSELKEADDVATAEVTTRSSKRRR